MKLFSCALMLLCCSYAVGQAAPTKSAPSAEHKAAADANQTKMQTQTPEEIAPDAPVITIPGVCNGPATGGKDCKTEVTRAQFEALANALAEGQPGGVIGKEMRQDLAQQYGQMLVFVHEAEQRRLDKDPATEVLLHFSRTQLMTERLLRSVQQTEKATQADIEKYYKDHSADYQGISLKRIMIPLAHSGGKTKSEDVKALAEEMRKRLVAGEDAGKLQQEAYTRLGFKMEPPDTARVLRASALSQNEQSLAKLKAGEVSDVFTDEHAVKVFKSEGPVPLPLDQVRAEIRSTVETQKVKAADDAIQNGHTPELNAVYFSPR